MIVAYHSSLCKVQMFYLIINLCYYFIYKPLANLQELNLALKKSEYNFSTTIKTDNADQRMDTCVDLMLCLQVTLESSIEALSMFTKRISFKEIF